MRHLRVYLKYLKLNSICAGFKMKNRSAVVNKFDQERRLWLKLH